MSVCLTVFHTWVWCGVTRGRVCNKGLESVVTMNGTRVADSVVANSVVANSVAAVLRCFFPSGIQIRETY